MSYIEKKQQKWNKTKDPEMVASIVKNLLKTQTQSDSVYDASIWIKW